MADIYDFNANDIQALNMFPSEGELVNLHITRLRVEAALSCKQALASNSTFSQIPHSLDLGRVAVRQRCLSLLHVSYKPAILR